MVPIVSFEFFPPKTPDMALRLEETITALRAFRPVFISVTYGAGGSTRDATVEWVSRLAAENNPPPAMHLTAVGASRTEIQALARQVWDAGVRHIVALRGDAPKSTAHYEPHPEGYAFAADLVQGLKAIAPFDISVAGYPETHPEALSPQADLDALKRKVEAGSSRIITQFFFDNADFLRYRDRVAAAGITVPVVAGMLPVYQFSQAERFAGLCGAAIPATLADTFRRIEGKAWQSLVAGHILARQCLALQQEGVQQFHFYTLNRKEIPAAVCEIIGAVHTDS